MKIIAAVMALLLGGCIGLGVQNMDAAQIRATEGIASCTDIYTMYGKGRSVIVHTDAAKKGIQTTHELIIGPDCTVTIRGSAAVPMAGQPTAPQPAVRTETTSTTTTRTIQDQPATPPPPSQPGP